MRRHRGSLLTIIVAVIAAPLFVVSSQEIRISDFRLPETRFQRLSFSLSGGVSRLDESISHTGENVASDGGNALMRYILHESSESTVMDFRPELSATFSYSESKRWDSLDVIRRAFQYRRISVDLPWQGSWYVGADPWHVYTSASIMGTVGFTQTDEVWPGWPVEYREVRDRGYDVVVGAGAGYGRMREGQSVFAILRVLERLRAESILSREATREEILELAQLYSDRPKYLSLFDRPEKYFFGDLISKLDSLGLVRRETLDARAVLNIADVRLESMLPRLFGWRVQIGLEHSSFQITRIRTASYGTRENRYFDRGSADFLVAAAEYGHDFSVQTHFYAKVGNKLVVTPRVEKQWSLEAECLFLYELGEYVEVVLRYASIRDAKLKSPEPDYVSHFLSADMVVYVEDRMGLALGAQYGSTRNPRSLTSLETQKRTSLSATFGLTYRLF